MKDCSGMGIKIRAHNYLKLGLFLSDTANSFHADGLCSFFSDAFSMDCLKTKIRKSWMLAGFCSLQKSSADPTLIHDGFLFYSKIQLYILPPQTALKPLTAYNSLHPSFHLVQPLQMCWKGSFRASAVLISSWIEIK